MAHTDAVTTGALEYAGAECSLMDQQCNNTNRKPHAESQIHQPLWPPFCHL